MDSNLFNMLRLKLENLGYKHEAEWAENVKPVSDINTFFCEYMWVVINSGMKNQIAKKIYDKMMKEGFDVFKHEGKVKAIKDVYQNADKYFREYLEAKDKLAYLETMPFIGKITKYHLAKNYGLDFCKPDRHLERIAKQYNTTPEKLCGKLAKETNLRIGTVDLIIWRSANLGMI